MGTSVRGSARTGKRPYLDEQARCERSDYAHPDGQSATFLDKPLTRPWAQQHRARRRFQLRVGTPTERGAVDGSRLPRQDEPVAMQLDFLITPLALHARG